jgi:hypothetical protein
MISVDAATGSIYYKDKSSRLDGKINKYKISFSLINIFYIATCDAWPFSDVTEPIDRSTSRFSLNEKQQPFATRNIHPEKETLGVTTY